MSGARPGRRRCSNHQGSRTATVLRESPDFRGPVNDIRERKEAGPQGASDREMSKWQWNREVVNVQSG